MLSRVPAKNSAKRCQLLLLIFTPDFPTLEEILGVRTRKVRKIDVKLEYNELQPDTTIKTDVRVILTNWLLVCQGTFYFISGDIYLR